MYKLVGPVLVPQEQAEATQTVDTRLEFIRGEMCVPSPPHRESVRGGLMCAGLDRKRVEGQLKDLGDKSEKKKIEVRARTLCSSQNMAMLTPSLLLRQLVELQTAAQQQSAPAPAAAAAA